MLIRKGLESDSRSITSLILLAMDSIIYGFIGDNKSKKAFQFLESLVCEKNNQYSYENCWVVEINEEVVAAAVIYDGAKLSELRAPVSSRINSMFNRGFEPEDETQAGELYIDSVGVNPSFQGKGIGSSLFQFLIDEYVHSKKKTLGLLVDKNNPDAKKFYLKLGFIVVGEKMLFEQKLDHLQYFS